MDDHESLIEIINGTNNLHLMSHTTQILTAFMFEL